MTQFFYYNAFVISGLWKELSPVEIFIFGYGMKSEAEICVTQSEKLCNEKMEFEDATYAKFLFVINAKKAKLRALRDKEDSGRAVEEEESTDKAESFESERSYNEESEEEASKKARTSSKARGRKKAARS